ncbi:ribosomal protein S12 methylthiotransferase RimO [uncultured Blautia sp.]|nr:ribosomal protein S12 methylthiotransferase RimO [uncultured Blautia sp.]
MDVQSDIIDAYNESVLGTEREVLCEGFDSQAQMHFGRSYAESPDIDGRIWFDANREVEPGTFVTVRLTGVMDGCTGASPAPRGWRWPSSSSPASRTCWTARSPGSTTW